MICIILFSKYLRNVSKINNIKNDDKYIKTVNISSLKNDSIYTEIKTKNNKKKIKGKANGKKTLEKRKSQVMVFDFNPNFITYDSILMLGVNKKAASNWIKYIKKGGKFKTKKDLKKIYSLKSTTFDKLSNHILLPDSIEYSKKISYTTSYKKKSENKDIQKIIDLNSCTADELKKLKGIGDILSKRIIKYRDKLGGFYSVVQIQEVYGLPKETYDNIKENLTIKTKDLKKIKINIATTKDLSRFPYLNYRLAKQLINYRIQHGHFESSDDLTKLKALDSFKIKKIEPYLDFALR